MRPWPLLLAGCTVQGGVTSDLMDCLDYAIAVRECHTRAGRRVEGFEDADCGNGTIPLERGDAWACKASVWVSGDCATEESTGDLEARAAVCESLEAAE